MDMTIARFSIGHFRKRLAMKAVVDMAKRRMLLPLLAVEEAKVARTSFRKDITSRTSLWLARGAGPVGASARFLPFLLAPLRSRATRLAGVSFAEMRALGSRRQDSMSRIICAFYCHAWCGVCSARSSFLNRRQSPCTVRLTVNLTN